MIKGVFSKLKMPAISALIAVSMLFSGVAATYGVSEIAYSSYAKNSQIDDIAKALNCIDIYRMSPSRRLQHNNGEPISVYISSEFSEQERQEIIHALDYIFGIVGGINSNYKYKLVSEEEANSATINISIKDLGDSINGEQITEVKNYLPAITDRGSLAKRNNVYISRAYLLEGGKGLTDVTLHELLHVLGLDDVYFFKTYEHISNTQINAEVTGLEMCMITPNDYKTLASMYHKPFKSQEERQAFVEKFNVFMEEYSYRYYKKHYQTIIQKTKASLENSGFTESLLEKFIEVEPLGDVDITIFSDLAGENVKYMKIKISGGKYNLESYDQNRTLVSKCSGNAYNIDGVIYMQGVRIDDFVIGLDTTTDMSLCYRPLIKKYLITTLTGNEYEYSEDKSFSNTKTTDGGAER